MIRLEHRLPKYIKYILTGNLLHLLQNSQSKPQYCRELRGTKVFF